MPDAHGSALCVFVRENPDLPLPLNEASSAKTTIREAQSSEHTVRHCGLVASVGVETIKASKIWYSET